MVSIGFSIFSVYVITYDGHYMVYHIYTAKSYKPSLSQIDPVYRHIQGIYILI